ncbi:glycosyltransferase family 4 protein [Gammaproteobacteria bacterium]|jgi:glycosyltransferase involved in cell wall biosynthesis|nr:glycosyltransferase family 4 protein [Gammaproteobacteria bacterium]|tara:strand:- start:96 stop:1232 length:1137 start_codon:yes stop_codon:yes gene_type:complete
MKKIKILFLVNVDWFFLSHRLPIALEAAAQGFEVHVATTTTDQAKVIEGLGFILHEVKISRGDLGIFTTFKTFLDIIKIFNNVRPKIVHLVTIKPIILGGIAARIANIHGVVAAISGLGYVFINQGFLSSVRRFFIKALYKIALGHSNLKVICQNSADYNEIKNISKLSSDSFVLINGSGVSLEEFQYFPDTNKIPKIIMASRMLEDKGVLEFSAAAQQLKTLGILADFILVGDPDPDNPSSIKKSQIQDWEQEGILKHWGHRDEMQEVLRMASIVVLPSYREGFPKVLIEAAACGRPVITTDVPGCRDAIYHGKTGMLVPPKNSNALADAIKNLVLQPEECRKMGLAGRAMAEERFDEKIVIEEHFSIYNQLLLNIK